MAAYTSITGAFHAWPISSRASLVRTSLALTTPGCARQEASTLLSFELPAAVDEEAPIVGKGNYLRHYRVVHAVGLQSVRAYVEGERRDAVRRAQRCGRYLAVDRLEVAEMGGGGSWYVLSTVDCWTS